VHLFEEKLFTMVNDLPDRIYTPVWLVMQLGALGAAPATGAAAWIAGNRQLAFRLVAAGSATWALSKVVKRLVGRARPASLLPATHVRGSQATGPGYLSGHAGVAVALGVAAAPHVDRSRRVLIAGLIPAVALARVYVGAHLPLDIVGGAALGLGVEATSALYQQTLYQQTIADPRRARLSPNDNGPRTTHRQPPQPRSQQSVIATEA
jgi:undecaprenyl-diphosphatase